MTEALVLEPGSFRDKANRVFYNGKDVLRALDRQALEHWRLLESKSFYQALSREGKIIPTQPASLDLLPNAEEAGWAAVLHHERIPFISYPYEWSFGMLKDAALLQLELLSTALKEDMVLKDASAFNIQWKGCRPIFIDVPSFVPWIPGSPWAAYRQFCEHFLNPLFLQAYRGIPFQPWLYGSLGGISVEDGSRLLARDFFKPGVLTDVLLHARFQRYYASTSRRIRDDLHTSGFRKDLIQANLTRLTKIVGRLSCKPSRSVWSDYAETRNYAPQAYDQKKAFVETAVKEKRRRLVWDLGCNTGDFSRLAAPYADEVIAVDGDAKVTDMLFQSLKIGGPSNILSLTLDVTDAPAGRGWLGRERKAFVDRGTPDLILCLALVHHVAIGSNIPLKEWIQWLASFGADLVIEFVSPEDPMVERLLRNKDAIHADYTAEHFEAVLACYFKINRRQPLGTGLRILYACRPL